MLHDLVLDANILGLSENPSMPEAETCRELLQTLIESDVILVVDEGFSLDESLNRSIIGHEYMLNARFGTIGYALLQTCASSQRMLHVSPTVTDANRRFIKRQIPRNTKDRIYVSVALQSTSLVLSSNDWDDFPVSVRRQLKRRFDLQVKPAHEILDDVKAA